MKNSPATAILLALTNLSWAAIDIVFDASGLGIDESVRSRDITPLATTDNN